MASVSWLPGWPARLLGWESSILGSRERKECRAGGLVPTWRAGSVPAHLERCAAACPPVSPPHPLLPAAVEGVFKCLLCLHRQGVGGSRPCSVSAAVITSAFKSYQAGPLRLVCCFQGVGAGPGHLCCCGTKQVRGSKAPGQDGPSVCPCLSV